MENDKERRGDCNAYLNRGGDTDGASVDVEDSGYKYIQYYEGNVYYFMGSSLYSVSKDGSSKKKIYTVGDGKQIGSWLFIEENYIMSLKNTLMKVKMYIRRVLSA